MRARRVLARSPGRRKGRRSGQRPHYKERECNVRAKAGAPGFSAQRRHIRLSLFLSGSGAGGAERGRAKGLPRLAKARSQRRINDLWLPVCIAG